MKVTHRSGGSRPDSSHRIQVSVCQPTGNGLLGCVRRGSGCVIGKPYLTCPSVAPVPTPPNKPMSPAAPDAPPAPLVIITLPPFVVRSPAPPVIFTAPPAATDVPAPPVRPNAVAPGAVTLMIFARFPESSNDRIVLEHAELTISSAPVVKLIRKYLFGFVAPRTEFVSSNGTPQAVPETFTELSFLRTSGFAHTTPTRCNGGTLAVRRSPSGRNWIKRTFGCTNSVRRSRLRHAGLASICGRCCSGWGTPTWKARCDIWKPSRSQHMRDKVNEIFA